MPPQAPFAPFQLRFVPAQPSPHRGEATNKDHPWLIACGRDVLDRHRVFLGPLATHACGRRDNPRLNRFYDTATKFYRDGVEYRVQPESGCKEMGPDEAPTTCIDYQNVWTFSLDHDRTWGRAPTLHSPPIEHVRSRLKSRFCKHQSPSHARSGDPKWRVGRVCTVTLDGNGKVLENGRWRPRAGNLSTVRQVLPTWSREALELPCLIVASDQPERELGNDPWRAVTVIPIVSPTLLSRGPRHPTIKIPKPVGEETTLYAITLLLFTIGYDQSYRSTRVRPGCPGFPERYVVPDAELDNVLKDIHRIFG